MIVDDLEHAISGIEDDDVHHDSLSRFVERLKMRAELNEEEDYMHLLHQVVLIRDSIQKSFFDELTDRVQGRLRDPNSEGDDPPLVLMTLVKALNGIDLEDAFNSDYGFVDRSAASEVIAASMGSDSSFPSDEEETTESTDHVLSFFVSVLQSEYDNLDEEYRERIQKMLTDIKHKAEASQDPINNVEEALREYNTDWHTEARGWP